MRTNGSWDSVQNPRGLSTLYTVYTYISYVPIGHLHLSTTTNAYTVNYHNVYYCARLVRGDRLATYPRHSATPTFRTGSTCTSTSCGTAGSPTGSRAEFFSSASSPHPCRWPRPSPSSEPGSCRPPSASTTIWACRTISPADTAVKNDLIIVLDREWGEERTLYTCRFGKTFFHRTVQQHRLITNDVPIGYTPYTLYILKRIANDIGKLLFLYYMSHIYIENRII